MKLIIGLGNPGKKYQKTRHNVGFVVLDKFIQNEIENYSPKFKINKKTASEICEVMIENEKVLLAKPLTFMNKSGQVVKKLLQFNNLAIDQCRHDFYIIHDDLDIPLGKYKIQFGKGPKVHKGVESVERALGTKNFWRVRVGVENRKPENRIPGETYVLQNFTKKEYNIIEKTIKEIAIDLKKRILETHD